MSDGDLFDPPARLSEEQLLAIRVADFRESRKMSQAALAQAMRYAGHKWSQSTVYKVENGERKLTFVEGFALARILGVEPDGLIESREIAGELIRLRAKLQMIPVRADIHRQDIRQAQTWLVENKDRLYADEISEIEKLIKRAKRSVGGDEA